MKQSYSVKDVRALIRGLSSKCEIGIVKGELAITKHVLRQGGREGKVPVADVIKAFQKGKTALEIADDLNVNVQWVYAKIRLFKKCQSSLIPKTPDLDKPKQRRRKWLS